MLSTKLSSSGVLVVAVPFVLPTPPHGNRFLPLALYSNGTGQVDPKCLCSKITSGECGTNYLKARGHSKPKPPVLETDDCTGVDQQETHSSRAEMIDDLMFFDISHF